MCGLTGLLTPLSSLYMRSMKEVKDKKKWETVKREEEKEEENQTILDA